MPLDQARNFSVFERQKIALSVGDRVRFTKNVKHRGQKFLNNELRTVVGIDEGKIILDKGEIVCNGAALHIDQGIAVTSHASQAKTVDQVIVSMPLRSFSQANEAQFYVSMPRARRAMHLFTDSKVALRDAVTRPSKRLSSWELVAGADVWLNTPLPPMEASGTSGMKAAFNGVLNFSVLDGWWIEGWDEGVTGWAIGKDGGPADVNTRHLRQAWQPPARGRVSMRSAVRRFGPEPVAQLPLDDLAVVIGRQGIDEPVVLRPLVPRDVIEAGPVEMPHGPWPATVHSPSWPGISPSSGLPSSRHAGIP